MVATSEKQKVFTLLQVGESDLMTGAAAHIERVDLYTTQHTWSAFPFAPDSDDGVFGHDRPKSRRRSLSTLCR